jgi:hypothetical protein
LALAWGRKSKLESYIGAKDCSGIGVGQLLMESDLALADPEQQAMP